MVANPQEIFDEIETPIGGVQPEQIMQVWHKIEPMLKRVVKPETGYTLDSVLYELQMAQLQAWIVGDFDGLVVTQIKTPPVAPVLWVQFFVGDSMSDWIDDWRRVMEAYAKACGCVAIEFAGRKGWNKIQESHPDYKAKWTIFRRELDHG